MAEQAVVGPLIGVDAQVVVQVVPLLIRVGAPSVVALHYFLKTQGVRVAILVY